ncbi:hypothetical protein [Methanolobus profundi]|nr:hypothetical protein [Methanolobus profundi]
MTDISDLNGLYGVFRDDVEYGLTEEETTAVSDHYPVFVDVSVSGDED